MEVYNGAVYDTWHNLVSMPAFFLHVPDAFTQSLPVTLCYKSQELISNL